MLGLAFKGNTDDVRSSVAIGVVQQLIAEGAEVRAYDPKAMEKAKSLVPKAIMVEKAEDVADGADALLILTEWNEFKTLPWAAIKKKMLSPLLFDGRNLLSREEMKAAGFQYTGIGALTRRQAAHLRHEKSSARLRRARRNRAGRDHP